MHGNKIMVQAGRGKNITADLIDNAQIDVYVADYTLAKMGDGISVQGKGMKGQPKALAEGLKINCANQLTGVKRRSGEGRGDEGREAGQGPEEGRSGRRCLGHQGDQEKPAEKEDRGWGPRHDEEGATPYSPLLPCSPTPCSVQGVVESRPTRYNRRFFTSRDRPATGQVPAGQSPAARGLLLTDRRRMNVAIRVGINGFGRIGRLVFRRHGREGRVFDVVGINDITDTKTLAYLLKYDSVHRRFNGEVSSDAESIVVNGKKIKAMAIKDPATLPWKELGVDVVIESTGIFTARGGAGKAGYASHLDAGARKVVLQRPGQGRARPDLRAGRQRRPAQAGDEVHQQRKLHDELPGPGRQDPPGQVRHRQGPDDDDPRLHERPARVGLAAQGSLSRPGRRVEHHSHEHRRRQGGRTGHSVLEGQDDRHFDARPGARPAAWSTWWSRRPSR